MTPVINQVVELDKRRGKSNRIKKFILLRISGCILGWGQDLLHKSMTAFVKSRAYNHWQTTCDCTGKHLSSAYMFFSAYLTMNRGFSHQKEKAYSETIYKSSPNGDDSLFKGEFCEELNLFSRED